MRYRRNAKVVSHFFGQFAFRDSTEQQNQLFFRVNDEDH